MKRLSYFVMLLFALSSFLFAQELPDGNERIANNTFETDVDSVSGWNLYMLDDSVATYNLDTNSVITDKNSIHVNVIKPYKDYPSGTIMLNTPVIMHKGSNYMISVKLRSTKELMGNAIWWCLYDKQDDPNSYYDGMWGQIQLKPDTTITFTAKFTSSFDDSTAFFSLDLGAIQVDSVELWVDDIHLVQEFVTPGVVPEGSGTAEDPYKIASLDNLSWLTQTPLGWWGKYYVQVDDIDASATKYWDLSDDNGDGDFFNDPNDSTEDGANDGWKPIGGEFEDCVYDGAGHTIDGLFCNRSTAEIGFIGKIISGEVKNLGLTNVDFTTSNEDAGGVIGYIKGGTITNCYSTGSVKGTEDVGGFTGYINADSATVTKCYSEANVVGTNKVGGFVGYMKAGNISECYSSGDVSSPYYAGGFIAYARGGSISDCYSLGDVTRLAPGENERVGGFAGYNKVSITNCYSIGSLTYDDGDTPAAQGFVGEDNGGSYTACFFDSTVSNQKSDTVAAAKTTAEMMTDTTFTNAGWDLANIWRVDHTYPDLRNNINNALYPSTALEMQEPEGSGTEDDPYKVTSLANLSWMTQIPAAWYQKHYIQINDIDVSATKYWDLSDDNGDGDFFNDPNDLTPAGANDGWKPIGGEFEECVYDGDGHVIDGLTINSESAIGGLFHYIKLSTVKNLGITNIDLHNEDYAAALVSDLYGTLISNVYSTGKITGKGEDSKRSGGLVAYIGGSDVETTIENCHSDVELINIGKESGGFLGIAKKSLKLVIKNCYATGDVNGVGTSNGGFAGKIQSSKYDLLTSTVYNCYSTGDVVGQAYTGGFIGTINPLLETIRVKTVNCYSTGNVHQLLDTYSDESVKTIAGGFCGYAYNVSDSTSYEAIVNCYSTGSVTFEYDTTITDMGFIGKNMQETKACFFDSTASNQKSDAVAAAKTTAEMMTESTFTDAGWDFENVWEIVGENYPTLREDALVSVRDDELTEMVPSSFELKQNYPNPFNPTTTIGFALPEKSLVQISVYNILGQKVVDIMNAKMNAGFHEVKFDASKMASGLYIYRIKAGKFLAVKKMMLLK